MGPSGRAEEGTYYNPQSRPYSSAKDMRLPSPPPLWVLPLGASSTPVVGTDD